MKLKSAIFAVVVGIALGYLCRYLRQKDQAARLAKLSQDETKSVPPLLDVYQLVFAEHHFASEWRMKTVQGWAFAMAALVAVFVWTRSEAVSSSWLAPALGGAVTAFMWLSDLRHRSCLGASKGVGAEIESGLGLTPKQSFFQRIEGSPVTHSNVIDVFSILIISFLAWATCSLASDPEMFSKNKAQEPFSPDKTAHVPSHWMQGEIVIDQSADLTNWTRTLSATYTNQSNNLYFRIRAERSP